MATKMLNFKDKINSIFSECKENIPTGLRYEDKNFWMFGSNFKKLIKFLPRD